MTATRSDTPKRRFRLRFGLRTLLIVMLLAGVVFGVLGMAYEADRQRKAVADLREAGAEDVEFSDEQVWMPELLDTGYCERVRMIWVGGEQFDNVSILTEFENLERLTLAGTQVSDVSPLAGCKNLTVLSLSGTQVSEVTPLAGLKNLNVFTSQVRKSATCRR